MCRLVGLSRAGFYRKPRQPGEYEMNLRAALHKAALEHPFYGYRRLTHELKRRGWKVGERRVRRMMREDNLLRLRKKRRFQTTDSRHGLELWLDAVMRFCMRSRGLTSSSSSQPPLLISNSLTPQSARA